MRSIRRRRAARLQRHAIHAAILVVTIAIAVFVARPRSANAQTPPRVGNLYAEVARANPRIIAAQALVRAARARVPGSMRPPDPQLQLGLMNRALPGLNPMQPLGMTQLQIMQMIPLGGKLSLAGRVAAAQADAASDRVEDVAWELRRQTAMAFYDLYATEQQLDVSRETIRLLQDIARTAESMYRVGEGRQADVLKATVEIAKMVEDTVRMQAMRKATTARLNALLNRDTNQQLSAATRPQFPDTVPAQAWLDSAAATARPMIRAGLHELRAADASAALATKEIIPDLQIGVQYGRGGSTMIDAAGTASTKTENMASLMIGASIPIFARDRQYQMRNEADAMKAMAAADLNAMRAETRGRIGEAYAELSRARDLTRLFRTTVIPQAAAAVSSAFSSYRVGKVDFMTLLDDQMTVNKYRQELIGLEAEEGKAWAELEMLTGRELIDSNSVATVESPNTASPSAKRGDI